MTLTEYNSQTTPVRMPVGHVVLQPGEFTTGITIQDKTQIFIKGFTGEYVYYSTMGNTLWAADDDGNPRARSCFALYGDFNPELNKG